MNKRMPQKESPLPWKPNHMDWQSRGSYWRRIIVQDPCTGQEYLRRHAWCRISGLRQSINRTIAQTERQHETH